WTNPLDQFLLVVLAVSHSSSNSLDGRKLFSASTNRGLWSNIADARHRLLSSAKGDHAKPRSEFCTCQRARQRYQRKDIANPLRDANGAVLRQLAAIGCHVCPGRGDVAHSRSSDYKNSP